MADIYNIDEVDFITSLISTGSASQISGFAPGTGYTASRDNAAMEMVQGADGLTVSAKTNKDTGAVTVNLLTTSPSNAVFQSYLALDDIKYGTGTFSMVIRDPNSTVVISSPHCQMEQPADYEGSDGAPERSWVIKAAPLNFDAV